jgi:hypothetical protein
LPQIRALVIILERTLEKNYFLQCNIQTKITDLKKNNSYVFHLAIVLCITYLYVFVFIVYNGTVEPRLSGPRLSGSPCYPETKSILKIPFYPEEFSSKLRLIRNWPCFVAILRSDKNIRSF